MAGKEDIYWLGLRYALLNRDRVANGMAPLKTFKEATLDVAYDGLCFYATAKEASQFQSKPQQATSSYKFDPRSAVNSNLQSSLKGPNDPSSGKPSFTLKSINSSRDKSNCGECAISVVLLMWGKQRVAPNNTPDGVTPLALIDMAKSEGILMQKHAYVLSSSQMTKEISAMPEGQQFIISATRADKTGHFF